MAVFDPWHDTAAGRAGAPHEDIVELVLALPAAQAAALERAAAHRGLTTAQVLRRLVREFLSPVEPARPVNPDHTSLE